MKAVLKNTKEVRAIKIIPKNKVTNQSRFKSEIEILRKLVFICFKLNIIFIGPS